MARNNQDGFVMTPRFRVAFAHVFKPRRANANAEPKYSVCALFPKGTDLEEMKALAKKAIFDKWGENPPKGLRSPFRKGEEKADEYDGFEAGMIFINMSSQFQPGICDHMRKDIYDAEEFYSGCWARAQVNAYAYDNSGNRGVSFGLQGLQKLGDGKPFSARRKASEMFGETEEIPYEDGGAAAPPQDEDDDLYD